MSLRRLPFLAFAFHTAWLTVATVQIIRAFAP